MYKHNSGTTTMPSEAIFQTLSSKAETYNKYQSLLLQQIYMNHLFLVDTKILMSVAFN